MTLKKIILVLLAFSLSFAQATVEEEFDGNLYAPVTSSLVDYLTIRPYLYFSNTLEATTTAEVLRGSTSGGLENNAIICEGNVELSSDVNGLWAHGGLYEFVDNWLECEPPSYTSVHNNQPIVWNTGDYNDLYDTTICSSEDGCWSIDEGMVEQRVNTYEKYYDDPSSRTTNRLGSTTVICKGVTTLRAGSTSVDFKVIGDEPPTGTIRLTRGNYALTSLMDVQGCLGVVRFHGCSGSPNFEKIFDRTRAESGHGAPPYTNTVGPATLNVRVVNNADLRCSADIFSVTPSPINISPGGSAHVTIRITNNCPASDPLCRPINVSNLRVTTSGFRYVPDLTISLPGPLGGGSTTSHRITARPGETITFSGTVIAPNDPGICEDLHGTIEFAADYQCPGCEGSTGGGSLTGTADITVPYECPPPDLNLTRNVNLVPRFDPDPGSTLTFRTGERPNISIMTWNRGMNFSNPGETCVVICDVSDVSCSDPVADYRYTYPALGPLEEFGDELDFVCSEEDERKTFDLFVGVDCTNTTNETSEIDNSDQRRIFCAPPTNETGDNETYSCDLTPAGPIPGRAGETYEFELDSCTKLGEAYDCISAETVDWSFARSGNATYTHEEGNDFGASFVMGTDSRGEGNVRVTARVDFGDGNATCSSDVYMPLVPCIDFV